MQAKSRAIAALIAGLIGLSGCAALQPTDTNGPRTNLPAYPIIVNEPTRIDETTLKQLSQRFGFGQNLQADLRPWSAKLQGSPGNTGTSIFLPKVGNDPAHLTEEEIRESLRRFITEWQTLIGADPNQLSLIERVDDAGGLKTARYEQRPFRYPMRGNFGTLLIRFQADRHVIDLSSTCVPNSDRLQAPLNSLVPKVTPERAVELVKGHQITAADSVGGTHSFTLSSETLDASQLVAYVKLSQDQQNIEVHLAWEIDVANGPIKTIYLDSITEQVIAVA